MKEKTLQQETNEYILKECLQYEKYILDFYNLHSSKEISIIKQLFKDELHLILSEDTIEMLNKHKFTSLYDIQNYQSKIEYN